MPFGPALASHPRRWLVVDRAASVQQRSSGADLCTPESANTERGRDQANQSYLGLRTFTVRTILRTPVRSSLLRVVQRRESSLEPSRCSAIHRSLTAPKSAA